MVRFNHNQLLNDFEGIGALSDRSRRFSGPYEFVGGWLSTGPMYRFEVKLAERSAGAPTPSSATRVTPGTNCESPRRNSTSQACFAVKRGRWWTSLPRSARILFRDPDVTKFSGFDLTGIAGKVTDLERPRWAMP